MQAVPAVQAQIASLRGEAVELSRRGCKPNPNPNPNPDPSPGPNPQPTPHPTPSQADGLPPPDACSYNTVIAAMAHTQPTKASYAQP